LLIAAAVLLAACGSSEGSSGSNDEAAGLVDLGGGRSIYLECHGEGSPTVVLISGGFEAGWIWSYALHPTDPVHEEPFDAFSAGRGDPRKLASAVFPAVGELTRVCTYDRPNTTLGDDIESERQGRVSSPVEQPHPVEHDVEDLHAVLHAAGEQGPYVLVAHSYGGLIAELYARTYPEEVAGRVNVDVTSAFLRDTLPPAEYQALIESTKTPPVPGAEALGIGAAIDAINAAEPAPLVPAIVLAADKPPDLEPPTLERFSRLGEAQGLLAQALCAQLITRTNSGHHIHVEQPQLVGDATRAVVEAIRD
jgi:pimeloyl-ACP methyl ester carboxylesterase